MNRFEGAGTGEPCEIEAIWCAYQTDRSKQQRRFELVAGVLGVVTLVGALVAGFDASLSGVFFWLLACSRR